MSFQIQVDDFIAQELKDHLLEDEEILSHGYLTSGVQAHTGTFDYGRDRMAAQLATDLVTKIPLLGKIISLVRVSKRQKAYFIALTNRRLFIIETRIGTFRILLENRGLKTYLRDEVMAVHLDGSLYRLQLQPALLRILFSDNKLMVLHIEPKRGLQHQRSFADLMVATFGGEKAGEDLVTTVKSSKKKRWLRLGIVTAVVFCGQSFYQPSASVSCILDAEQTSESVAFVCDIEHTGGFPDARPCWALKMICSDGRTARSKDRCIKVARGLTKTATIYVQQAQFMNLQGKDGAFCAWSPELDVWYFED